MSIDWANIAKEVFQFVIQVLPDAISKLIDNGKDPRRDFAKLLGEIGKLWEKHDGDPVAARRDIAERKELIEENRKKRDRQLVEKHAADPEKPREE